MNDFYGLDGQRISRDEWGTLIDSKHAARRLSADGDSTPETDPTRIGSDHVGEAWVSTVWMGIDHQFGDGPPLIFETMVFGGPHDDDTYRYSTRQEAEAAHRRVVDELRQEANDG